MGHERGDFQIEGVPEVHRIVCLRRPTAGFEAPSSKHSLWRLVSQLSLNHLSLVEEGQEALQWLLRLHNIANADFGTEAISGIVELRSRPHFARVSSEHGMAFVRGKLIELGLDEQRFVGTGAYLFASVLENFLSLYTSLNSFTQLTLRTRQRGDQIVASWPPRAGSKVVL
jgi:type VI secretion system protein ImpG